MLPIKELILKYLSIIRVQREKIKLLEKEIQEIESTRELQLYEVLSAISGEYKSLLDPKVDIPSSYEHSHEIFKTSTSNIACYFTYNPDRKGNLTKIILLENCESEINTFRVTNEIVYRISLQKVQKRIDQQQIQLAQISKSVFVNVAYYELFKRKDKCIAKSMNNKIKKEYATFEVSNNYVNSFKIVKKNYKRFEVLNKTFGERISVLKNVV